MLMPSLLHRPYVHKATTTTTTTMKKKKGKKKEKTNTTAAVTTEQEENVVHSVGPAHVVTGQDGTIAIDNKGSRSIEEL